MRCFKSSFRLFALLFSLFSAVFRSLISFLCKTKFHLLLITHSHLFFLPLTSPSPDTHFVFTSPFVHPVKGHSPLKPRFHIGTPLFGATFIKVLHLLASLSKRCSKKWSTYVYPISSSGSEEERYILGLIIPKIKGDFTASQI